MNNEITVKVKCELNELYKILEEKGFKVNDKFALNDTYLVPEKLEMEKLSVREILSHAVIIRNIIREMPKGIKNKITFKKKEFDSEGNILNQTATSCEIKDIEEAKKLFKAIGYKEIMNIKERDLVYGKEGFELAIKDIQNGEKLIEIETVEDNEKLNTIENVIIGVGIDANLDVEDFPEELREGTTTLQNELGRKGSENLLIKTFLEEFEEITELFDHEGYEEILKEWRKRSYSIGKIVEVREPFNKNYDAYVLGVSREGALIVEKIDGTLEKVISGECIIKN